MNSSFGLEMGMVVGVVISCVVFVISYARIRATAEPATTFSSSVRRPFEHRIALSILREHVHVITLQGYIFFGSAIRISNDISRSCEKREGAAAAINEATDAAHVTTEESNHRDNSTEQLSIDATRKTFPKIDKEHVPLRFIVLDFENVTGCNCSTKLWHHETGAATERH